MSAIGWLEPLDDGRIRFVTDEGVRESERPVPEPDPNILDDLPDVALNIDLET